MECIIFDADHTLYTPEADRAYERKFAFLAEQTGVDPGELSEAWEQVVSREREDTSDLVYRKTLIREMLEAVGIDPAEELVEEAYTVFWDTVVDDLTYDEEVPAMLARLNQRYNVLAIATDEFPEALDMKLSTVFDDVDALFDDIVTPKDAGVMKPSTRFYRQILDANGIAPDQAMMVGDSWRRDLQPAKELGMATVLVRADRSDDPLEPGEEPDAAPDHRIDRITALEALLEDQA